MKAENNKILKEKKNWILLLFKKLAKLIFNRIFYVAVAMLVQLGAAADQDGGQAVAVAEQQALQNGKQVQQSSKKVKEGR